jgi:two-component system chemotaxis response regulator CheY
VLKKEVFGCHLGQNNYQHSSTGKLKIPGNWFMIDRLPFFKGRGSSRGSLFYQRRGEGCMKILVIDDSLVHRKIIKNSIKHLGTFEMVEASSGIEALTRLDGVSLIITDWNMEGMDGLEFTVKVRETNKHIPIIMMSSNNAPEDLEQATKAGVTEYIVKPFSKSDLDEKIGGYISQTEESSKEDGSGPFVEKRKHIRFSYVLAVKHRTTGTELFLESYCCDISLGGLKLLTPASIEPGQQVELEVHFPEDVREPFLVQGVVKWCLPSEEFNEKFHAGISFTSLGEEQYAAVKQLIESEKEIRSSDD